MMSALRILAACLTLVAAPSHSDQAPSWFAFAPIPESVRTYKNDQGVVQHDALLMYAGSLGSGTARVAVVGCAVGKGAMGSIDDSGKPTGQQHQWDATMGRRYDQVALSICLVAARLLATPQATPAPKGLAS